jgi:hypothetical protein
MDNDENNIERILYLGYSTTWNTVYPSILVRDCALGRETYKGGSVGLMVAVVVVAENHDTPLGSQ